MACFFTASPALGDAASLRVECAIVRGRPTTEQCATKLDFETKASRWDEVFALSFNDPIEYFRYESYWKPWDPAPELGKPFVRIPVLGGIRDRFLDGEPFGDTMLFTTSVVGGGWLAEGRLGTFAVDATLVFAEQRYATTYAHTEVDSDPENNRRFRLSHLALWRSAFYQASLPGALRAGLRVQVVELDYRGRYLADVERELFLRAPLVALGQAQLGLAFQAYWREHTIRHDDGRFELGIYRGGILAEF